MNKYAIVLRPDRPNEGTIVERVDDTEFRALSVQETVALLNTPTPPPTGIVWKKPGEPGRVDRKMYLVTPNGLDCWSEQWNKTSPNDGWHSSDLIAWADLPSPPAWAGGAA